MNIRALETYVESKNNWERLFKQPELSLLIPEHRQRIADSICADLSPENLTCDGELTAHQVRQRLAFLTRCLEELKSIDSRVEITA